MIRALQHQSTRVLKTLHKLVRGSGDPLCKVNAPDFDENAVRLFEKVQPYTMTSIERVSALVEAVKYIVTHEVNGAIVECGVWKGGSMMAAALTLGELGATDREMYLFDTFEGMTKPSESDVNYRGQSANDLMHESNSEQDWIWARCHLDNVHRALETTGYPMERIHFVKGKVEDTVPDEAPDEISLLRLDTDWYQSTRHEMEHLFPRLCKRGVLIIDDYGHWNGARTAVDEFISSHQVPILLNRIDYTGRIAVKL